MTRHLADDNSNPLEGISTDFAALLRTVADDGSGTLPGLGTVIGNKYEIVGVLGRGGMGVVYAAKHCLTGKLFALKWLLPDLSRERGAVDRFVREAIAAGKVEHPNVVEIYDVDHDGTSHYMIMQLVRGDTLANRLAQRGRLGYVEACQILIQVIRGVAAVHAEGIVHRDLKPQNIILARTKQGGELPKVLDFGISTILPRIDEHTAATGSGPFLMGTPSYMSPEQLRSGQIDARTDVYGLGVIAYQMLSGTLPFTASNISDLICKVLHERPPPVDALVSDVPHELSEVIAHAMAFEASSRFESVATLAYALEPFAGSVRFSLDVGSVAVELTVVDGDTRASESVTTSTATTPFAFASRAETGSQSSPRIARAALAAAALATAALVSASLWLIGSRVTDTVASGPTAPANTTSSVRAVSSQPVPAPGGAHREELRRDFVTLDGKLAAYDMAASSLRDAFKVLADVAVEPDPESEASLAGAINKYNEIYTDLHDRELEYTQAVDRWLSDRADLCAEVDATTRYAILDVHEGTILQLNDVVHRRSAEVVVLRRLGKRKDLARIEELRRRAAIEIHDVVERADKVLRVFGKKRESLRKALM